jgi:hypothetical protein
MSEYKIVVRKKTIIKTLAKNATKFESTKIKVSAKKFVFIFV